MLAFSIVAGMMGALRLGTSALRPRRGSRPFGAVLVGIVPADKAFDGLQRRHRHHRRERPSRQRRGGEIRPCSRPGLNRVGPYLRTTQIQIIVLVTVVTVLSAFVKNIGALAMMIPVAFQIARRTNTPPSSFLMPMAFGSLLGGIVTLVGTSPNIIVSRVRRRAFGRAFRACSTSRPSASASRS